MGSNKKRQQTVAKRNRERAVEEKRTLKRLRKQEAAAERAAARAAVETQPTLPSVTTDPEQDSPRATSE
jgi:hypothetical protein